MILLINTDDSSFLLQIKCRQTINGLTFNFFPCYKLLFSLQLVVVGGGDAAATNVAGGGSGAH